MTLVSDIFILDDFQKQISIKTIVFNQTRFTRDLMHHKNSIYVIEESFVDHGYILILNSEPFHYLINIQLSNKEISENHN